MTWNGRQFFHLPYWQFSSIPFPFDTKNIPFHISFHTKAAFTESPYLRLRVQKTHIRKYGYAYLRRVIYRYAEIRVSVF